MIEGTAAETAFLSASDSAGRSVRDLVSSLDEMKYTEAALTLALIYLKDGLQLADALGRRITDTGPDIEAVGKEGDLTSLILYLRNVACHMGSKAHIVDPLDNYLRYNVILGQMHFDIGDLKFENPHPDDVAFFYGPTRLYLRRNMILAVDKLSELARELLPSS